MAAAQHRASSGCPCPLPRPHAAVLLLDAEHRNNIYNANCPPPPVLCGRWGRGKATLARGTPSAIAGSRLSPTSADARHRRETRSGGAAISTDRSDRRNGVARLGVASHHHCHGGRPKGTLGHTAHAGNPVLAVGACRAVNGPRLVAPSVAPPRPAPPTPPPPRSPRGGAHGWRRSQTPHNKLAGLHTWAHPLPAWPCPNQPALMPGGDKVEMVSCLRLRRLRPRLC